jgi:hypothetical protein
MTHPNLPDLTPSERAEVEEQLQRALGEAAQLMERLGTKKSDLLNKMKATFMLPEED